MLPALKVGGLYPAQVLDILPEGRVRLGLRDTVLEARTRRPLLRGEQVVVEVEQIWPELVLRVRGAAVPAGGRQKLPR